MKTLILTFAVLALSFTTLSAKDGTFTSVIVKDSDRPLELTIGSHEWVKVINFVQNNGETETYPAGLAVFKGDDALWVLFASNPSVTNSPVIVAGPATLIVQFSEKTSGASALLTYQRGSD